VIDPRDTHRPRTPAERRPAVHELRRRGLKPRDVAQALRVPLGEVVEAFYHPATDARGGPTP
jgi:hypothetical protein